VYKEKKKKKKKDLQPLIARYLYLPVQLNGRNSLPFLSALISRYRRVKGGRDGSKERAVKFRSNCRGGSCRCSCSRREEESRRRNSKLFFDGLEASSRHEKRCRAR